MGKRNRATINQKNDHKPLKMLKSIKKQKKKGSKQKEVPQDDKIDEFLSEIDTNSLTHDQFLQLIRSKCQTIAKGQKDGGTETFVKEYYLEKFCEVCKKFNDDDKMLLCDFCEDSYHMYCLNPPLKSIPPEDEDWICQPCALQQKENNKKQRQSILDEYYETQKDMKIKNCQKCKKDIQQPVLSDKKRNSITVTYEKYDICIRCQHNFHQECFNKKKTSIVCKDCEIQINSEIPEKQSTILNYFKTLAKQNKEIDNDDDDYTLDLDEEEKQQKIKIRLKSMSPTKKIIKSSQNQKVNSDKKQNNQPKDAIFQLPKPITDPQKLLEQKKSMIYALKAKQIQFDDDLRFSTKDCPPEANNTDLEPHLQKISKENQKIFKKFKEMTREGNYPPVIIEEDKLQGFIVRALDNIPQLTLICEYVGQVDFLRNRVFDKNDSIMELLKTARSQTTLLICPEKYGNLARFISGINNTEKNSKAKQNVQSIRMSIDNHARVLLYAKKNIKKGDILYYDYNAGGFAEYPTHYFV